MFKQSFMTILLCCIFTGSSAAIETDFSGSAWPAAWKGDTSLFEFDGDRLRLNAPAEQGQSFLSKPLPGHSEMEWVIHFSLDFPPSANNRIRIFLESAAVDPQNAASGTYLQVGETGTDDAFELYRISGTQTEKLIRSSDGIARRHRDDLRVKVRNTGDQWELRVDTTQSGLYTVEGSTAISRADNPDYFSIECMYTQSRSDRFYFDYLYAGPPQRDTLPPTSDSLLVKDDHTLEWRFDKPLDPNHAYDPNAFSILQTGDQPVDVRYEAHQYNRLILEFENPIPKRKPLTLKADKIRAFNGEEVFNLTVSFNYFEAAINEVIVTEIMSNPNPPVDLPEHEYIELYNRTTEPVSLEGWRIASSGRETKLPEVALSGNEYLILCPASAEPLFEPFGKAAGVTNWPGFNITSDAVTLYDDKDRLMFHTSYEREWLQPEEKQQGGWSLEMVDADFPCAGSENWQASMADAGGTPGKPNSVSSSNPDHSPPTPLSAWPVNDTLTEVVFDQQVDSQLATQTHHYRLLPDGVKPLRAVPVRPSLNTVLLHWDIQLKQEKYYELEIEGIADCHQNYTEGIERLPAGILHQAGPQDLLINEVLFNPPSGGTPFIELVNSSGRLIDISRLQLANYDSIIEAPDPLREVAGETVALFPGEYAVLTRDKKRLRALYKVPDSVQILEISPFISLPNDQGNLMIINDSSETIDAFSYNKAMHVPLLDSPSGVSLERISKEQPTQKASNWHSASGTAGFATPGLPNSQRRPPSEVKTRFTFDERVFSPVSSKAPDFVRLEYKMDQPGYRATVRIFDISGRPVRSLAIDELLSRRGSLKWEGTADEGYAVNPGVYIWVIELIHPTEGKTEAFQKAITVGG